MVDAVEKEQFTNPMVSMVTKWVFSTADSHPSEPKNGFHGPFYVLYRSNVLFSGLSSSQGLVQDGGPFDDLQKAVHEYAKKKGQLHGYGVCDKDGNVVVYNAATTSSFVKKFCAAAIRQETKQTTASAGPAAEEKNESHSGDTRPEPPGGFKPPFYVLYRSKVPASGLSPAGGLVKDGGPFANVPQALQHYERKKGGIFYKYGVCDQEGNLVTCDAVVQTRSFNTPKCCQAAIPASSTTESGPSASLQEMLETQSVEQSSPGILAKTFFSKEDSVPAEPTGGFKPPFYVLYRSKFPASGLSAAGGLVKDGGPFANVQEALKDYQMKKGGVHSYGICDQEGNIMVYNAMMQTRSFNTKKCCGAAIEQK